MVDDRRLLSEQFLGDSFLKAIVEALYRVSRLCSQTSLEMGRKMPIVLARIDDRLIHGQITVSWSKVTNPAMIAVVSDKVASNDIQRSALGLGTPLGIELAIYSVKQAMKELSPKSPRSKTDIFVIAPTPKDFLDLIKGGDQDRVNKCRTDGIQAGKEADLKNAVGGQGGYRSIQEAAFNGDDT